jgi:hypothetical protein
MPFSNTPGGMGAVLLGPQASSPAGLIKAPMVSLRRQ